mgnify:CR=1 FL=1
MPLSDEELQIRIDDLNNAGMTLAAKALMKELDFRKKRAA